MVELFRDQPFAVAMVIVLLGAVGSIGALVWKHITDQAKLERDRAEKAWALVLEQVARERNTMAMAINESQAERSKFLIALSELQRQHAEAQRLFEQALNQLREQERTRIRGK